MMKFDFLTRLIATMLWSAHVESDPSYEATPGLTVRDSMSAAADLCHIAHGGVWS